MERQRILIVEDEVIAAMSLEAKLAALRYESVGIALTGSEAIAMAHSERPDLILMDIKLKGPMDGIEASATIGRSLSIPVVYLTAFSDVATLDRARDTAPFGYLIKPVTDNALRSTLKMALERSRLARLTQRQTELAKVIAEFSKAALSDMDGERLIEESIERLATALHVDFGLHLEQHEAQDAVEVRLTTPSGPPSAARRLPLGNGADSLWRAVSQWKEAVAVDLTAASTRFTDAELISELGIVIGAFTRVAERDGGDGALAGLSSVQRTFPSDELAFLSSMADILAHGLSRRTLEKALREAKSAAETASQTKSEFLANMSHEFRTPLNAVLGFAELLAAGAYETEAERADQLATIIRNGNALLSLINDVLDLAKVEAGKVTPLAEEFSLAALLDDVSGTLSALASKKRLHVDVDDGGVPLQDIVSDRKILRQILMNVGGNAVKFTDKGSVTIRVRQDPARRGGGVLKFEIEDTGCGVKREDAARLFAPFTQLDASTTRKYGGTGLGLALAKRLARALGGDVELTTSTPGVGSTFTVHITCAEPATARARKNAGPASGPPTELLELGRALLAGCRILVIEDNLDNQLVISRFLGAVGASVHIARDGEEGVAKARSAWPDVVLMDLHMPVMDGYEATATLRRRGFDRPIIALTARAMPDDVLRCRDAGFDDHLAKPIELERLLQILSKHVRRR